MKVSHSQSASLILVALFAGMGSAQIVFAATPAEAWFGLELPDQREQRSARHRAVYASPDFPPLSLHLPAADDPYAGISGADVHRDITEIVELTRANRPRDEKYWGRIAGSPAELATAEYLADRLAAAGLEQVRIEPVSGGAQWWPTDWSVTLVGASDYGPGTKDYQFKSAFPAVQLGKGALQVAGLERELVYLGLGHAEDLLGRDLHGKIAVVRAELLPDPFFQSARGHIEKIVAAGASAVVVVMNAPGNHQYALEHTGAADVPCFILGGDDGRFLVDALVAADGMTPLRLRVSIDATVRAAWQGGNVVAELPGQTDEVVIVMAHLDGYFDAANDNAGGLAALLALARHFSVNEKDRPRRRHVFLGTSGHHEFSDGAKAFIAAHPDVIEKTVLVFNIEHPSSISSYYRGPFIFGRGTLPGQLVATTSQGKRAVTVSNNNPFLLSLYKESVDRYGLVVDAMQERRPNGDAFDFFLAGLTVVQILDANLWFHSSGDRPDTIHPHGLERAVRQYADVLDRVDQVGSDILGK